MKKTYIVEVPEVHVSLPVRLPNGLTGVRHYIANAKSEQEAREPVA